MKEKDRKRLSEMVAAGESTSTIVAIFKVFGYTEEEVLSEIPDVEPVVHTKDAPLHKPLALLKRTVGKKGKAEMLIMLFLFLCLILFSAYFAMPFLPQAAGDGGQLWDIRVLESKCTHNVTTLTLQNADNPPLPPTQFRVVEVNATCNPIIALSTVWAKSTVTCKGTFKDGLTYTVSSNRSKDDWFTCRYQ
ncbi:MAG: hypothetical protein KAW41_04295 [Candidatus Diapherotrites archaeon]|nr:hypothetical protein [Candidatus Diapherotrites archaeon]